MYIYKKLIQLYFYIQITYYIIIYKMNEQSSTVCYPRNSILTLDKLTELAIEAHFRQQVRECIIQTYETGHYNQDETADTTQKMLVHESV